MFITAAERSKTSSTASCRAAAIALHYFVLADFMWMAVEAYNMYLCFVKILPKGQSYFMIKCLIAGWGKYKIAGKLSKSYRDSGRSVIEGAHIHIFGFTHCKNNQFQKKLMRQHLNI